MNNEAREAQRELFEIAKKNQPLPNGMYLDESWNQRLESGEYKASGIESDFYFWIKALESQPKRGIRLPPVVKVGFVSSTPFEYVLVEDLVKSLELQGYSVLIPESEGWSPI
jgi:hypothetical protein